MAVGGAALPEELDERFASAPVRLRCAPASRAGSNGGTLTRLVPLDFTTAVAAIRAEITEIDERLKDVDGLTAKPMAQLTALDGVMPTFD